jgi:ubiquinone/menaquinone biosynthesis C-methylase UbiE
MDPRTVWGSGSCAVAAERISEVGERVVERAGVEPGMEVLDVACGSGNATIPAARAGARVTGLDVSADLLALARERCADAMVEIDWVEGDAQELPFGDAGFDRVLSTFGHMFAPDHERAAAELRRVCRPGGAIAVACWTPHGPAGRMLGDLPTLWGTEAHLRKLLGDGSFEQHEVEWEIDGETFAGSYLLAVVRR